MLLLLAIGFVAGVVTALSPCVLPVLPIVLAGGATGRRPLAIVAGIVVSFTVFTLFAAWLLDLLGLPEDVLRNLAIGLLFVVALTLLVPQFGGMARTAASVPDPAKRRRPRRRLPARSQPRARLRPVRGPRARGRDGDRGPPRRRARQLPADALLRARRGRADARDRVRRPARRARLPHTCPARPPRLGRAGRRSGARDHVRRRPEPADRPARLHGGAPEALRALRRGAARAAGADRRPRPRGDRRSARRSSRTTARRPTSTGSCAGSTRSR